MTPKWPKMTLFGTPFLTPFEPSWPFPLIKPSLNGDYCQKGSKRGSKRGPKWPLFGPLFGPSVGKEREGRRPKRVQKGSFWTLQNRVFDPFLGPRAKRVRLHMRIYPISGHGQSLAILGSNLQIDFRPFTSKICHFGVFSSRKRPFSVKKGVPHFWPFLPKWPWGPVFGI